MLSKPKNSNGTLTTLRGRLDISILDLEADGVRNIRICNSRSLTQTVILCLARRKIDLSMFRIRSRSFAEPTSNEAHALLGADGGDNKVNF